MCGCQQKKGHGSLGRAVHATLEPHHLACSTLRFQILRLDGGSRSDCMRHTPSSSLLKRCAESSAWDHHEERCAPWPSKTQP